jgi:hypothetical protein
LLDVLKADKSLANVVESFSEFLSVEADVEPSRFLILFDVIDDLIHFVLEILLISLIVADKSRQTLISFQLSYLII